MGRTLELLQHMIDLKLLFYARAPAWPANRQLEFPPSEIKTLIEYIDEHYVRYRS